ncbi:hypothetical protein [Methanosarcina horonobensis]|uniref:hypothetical protein n=1 Tax=Methanosarcina horonobensis TaxID=418008 RepID=UPI000A7B9DAA|nr:hypothetical protein [Methanosarcina horonobensis]
MKRIHILGGLLMGSASGVIAGLIAGIMLKYLYDKYVHEEQIHKKTQIHFHEGP